jgi:hypothetical protein
MVKSRRKGSVETALNTVVRAVARADAGKLEKNLGLAAAQP